MGFAVVLCGSGVAWVSMPEALAVESLSEAGLPGVAWTDRVRSLLGCLVMIFLAWMMSTNRRRIPWPLVAKGLVIQILIGALASTSLGRSFFGGVGDLVNGLLSYSQDGAGFLFGDLARQNNLPVGASTVSHVGLSSEEWLARARMGPIETEYGQWVAVGAYFAFGVLPTIVFFSGLMAVLYHLGWMQWVLKGFAWGMQKTLRTSGAETLAVAGNVFLGHTEAPLLVRPYLARMSESELMALATGGLATVAGGVMVAYVGILRDVFPAIAGHLLAASVMSAPAALVVAKILVPGSEPEGSLQSVLLPVSEDYNIIDALARGAAEGTRLAVNVGAMLLTFIAVVSLLNGLLGFVGGSLGLGGLRLEMLLGWVFAPLAWCMGIASQDVLAAGALLGVKTALNEFYAYVQLREIAATLEPRTVRILSYALCGFANFGSLGVMVGGLSTLIPERRALLARIAWRAMLGGTLAAFMTACVAGAIE